MRIETTTDTTEFFIEYHERFAPADQWMQMRKSFPSFGEAHARIQKIKELADPKKGPDQYRVRFHQLRDFVMWTTEDGDE